MNKAGPMDDLLSEALRRSVRYLHIARQRRVSPLQAAVDRVAELGGELPDGPSTPEHVLAMLDDIGSPATVINAGGRYFGFVNGGALPAALAANSVATGEESHVTLFKALSLLGLGRERVIRVPTDRQGRMRADKLPALSSSTIVCIQAGNVNTGAFDPARAVCEAARAAGAWVHIDGAFGLWVAASPRRRHLADGIELAQSWATDAHKWLNVPYDCGVALVREPGFLEAAMSTSASYLAQGADRHPFRLTPEMSRRARSVDVWAALRSLGRTGLAELIERCCRHAARLADSLRAAGYAVLNEVALNQVLVSFGDAATTSAVIAGIQQDGTCWCGGTVWQGQTAMRISVSSWATTDEDVDRSLAAMLRVASDVLRHRRPPAARTGS